MKDTVEIFKHLSMITHLGLTMVATIMAGFGIGYLIDKKADCFPTWTVVFTLLGIASGFWSVYKLIMKQLK